MAKDKKEIFNEFCDYIDKVSNDNKIKRIGEKVSLLNDKLDIHDSKLEDFFDTIKQKLTSNAKKKIKNNLKDIFDKYEKYDGNEIAQIEQLLKDVISICNEDFWDRLKNVFRGS